MPLVWAHGEFIKLCYSRALGYPIDRPVNTWNRYRGIRPEILQDIWGPQYRPRLIKAGDQFTIVLRAPARVHWGSKGWKDVKDSYTRDTGIGVHIVDISIYGLTEGESVQFTFYWLAQNKWEGKDYEVHIVA